MILFECNFRPIPDSEIRVSLFGVVLGSRTKIGVYMVFVVKFPCLTSPLRLML